MKHFLFAVMALSLLAPALPAMAHPGPDHRPMGTISSIDKNKVVVKSTEGKDVTFEVIPVTAFKKGKDKGMLSDLKVGMRVVILSTGEGDPIKAREIQYSATTTTAKK